MVHHICWQVTFQCQSKDAQVWQKSATGHFVAPKIAINRRRHKIRMQSKNFGNRIDENRGTNSTADKKWLNLTKVPNLYQLHTSPWGGVQAGDKNGDKGGDVNRGNIIESTLFLPSVGDDAKGQYRFKVTNKIAEANSQNAELDVLERKLTAHMTQQSGSQHQKYTGNVPTISHSGTDMMSHRQNWRKRWWSKEILENKVSYCKTLDQKTVRNKLASQKIQRVECHMIIISVWNQCKTWSSEVTVSKVLLVKMPCKGLFLKLCTFTRVLIGQKIITSYSPHNVSFTYSIIWTSYH